MLLFDNKGIALSREYDRIFGSDARSCAVICDATVPTMPIVFATSLFLRLTGFQQDQVVGRSCKFLQGPGTSKASLDELHEALEAKRPASVTLLNYSATGARLTNRLSVRPYFDDSGTLQRWLGYQRFDAYPAQRRVSRPTRSMHRLSA